MRPRMIDDMGWAMAEVYGAVTDRIMINLAKYFPFLKAGVKPPGSFQYQAAMLAKMGQVRSETIEIITRSMAGADEALRDALQTAILDALKTEEPKLQEAAKRGLLPVTEPPAMSPSKMQAFRAYYNQSADKLNLVNTVMLESTEQAYQRTVADITGMIQRTQAILNEETGEVVSGVTAYNQAVRDGVRRMVDNGLTGFIDHGGHHWSPEAYAAMDIKTTMWNTARAATWERMEQYGNDLYQVSWHNGARPLCYPWQGKVISKSGWTGTVKDDAGNDIQVHAESEIESFNYGGGLFGVNCGHYPISFVPGFSRMREPVQDEQENAKQYAESQQQRALERDLRYQKRDLEVLKAQGAPPEEIREQRGKVREASRKIDEFCDETGRVRRRARESANVDATWPDEGGTVRRFRDKYEPVT